MSGLRNICRAYGGMKVTGSNGKTVNYVWDYAGDEPCKDHEMPVGSDRWKASERARAAELAKALSTQGPRP